MNTTIFEEIGQTPLVDLETVGGPSTPPIRAKCEHMNPGGSIKDRIARAIVADAEDRGDLEPGMTLVEATAGNTGMGLALVAAARGYDLVCVMPEKMSDDKRDALRSLGAEVRITPNASLDSPDNFRNVARRLGEQPDCFLTDQFRNPVNVEIHAEETAGEILEQTGGRVGAFVVGAGTGGTISGVGRTLKTESSDVEIVLADPVGSELADWVETGGPGDGDDFAVEGIGSSEPPENLDLEVVDSAERISDETSFATARRLIRQEGLFVGGSAGTNVAAALRVARRDSIEEPVITVLPDLWDRYLSKSWLRESPEA